MHYYLNSCLPFHLPKNLFFYRNDWTQTIHLRAMDIWVVLCYIGVFYALMEYCLILYLTKLSILDQKFSSNHHKQYELANQDDSKTQMDEEIMERNFKVARVIEKFSRITLIAYICIFPICYFVVCTTLS